MSVTYTGELNAQALARTFLHVEEWLAEKAETVDEADVVEIVRMYEGNAVAEEFVPTSVPVFVERRKASAFEVS